MENQKKNNYRKIPNTLSRDEEKIKKLLPFIEEDVMKKEIEYNKYKKIIDNSNSYIKNFIAMKLSKMDINVIRNFADTYLFKEKDDYFDSFIIRLLICSSYQGIEYLLDTINNFDGTILETKIINTIGKYMCDSLENTWNVVYKYYSYENKNINLVYVLTRYLSFISLQNEKRVKRIISPKELKKIYMDFEILNGFKKEKLIDSAYSTNFDEYTSSIIKLFSNISEAELMDFDYKKQYEDSIWIFFENFYFLQYIYIQECLDGENNYNVDKVKELGENICKHHIVFENNSFPKILSDFGLKKIGKELLSFYEEINEALFIVSNKEAEIIIDKYENFLLSIINKYGCNEYKKYFFKEEDCLLHNKMIFSDETEKIAINICKKYIQDFSIDTDETIKKIFSQLVRRGNKECVEAIHNFLLNEEEDYSDKHQKIELDLIRNITNSYMLGLYDRIYGDISFGKNDYCNIRANTGLMWERLVGLVLYENYENIAYQKKLSNRTIPDYILYEEEKIKKIFECKLVLNNENVLDVLTKYHKYTNELVFVCKNNCICEKQLNEDLRFRAIKNEFSKDFKYTIIDYNSLLEMTNVYYRDLIDFNRNKIQFDKYKMLKNRILEVYPRKEAKMQIELIELIFNRS